MLFGATISITCRRDSSSDKFCSPKVVFQSDVISEDDLDNSKMDDLDDSTSEDLCLTIPPQILTTSTRMMTLTNPWRIMTNLDESLDHEDIDKHNDEHNESDGVDDVDLASSLSTLDKRLD